MTTILTEKLEEAKELRETVEAIEERLEAIKELWGSADLPDMEDLRTWANLAGSVQTSLEAIRDLWGGDDLPTIDELKEYAEAAGQAHGPLDALLNSVDDEPETWESIRAMSPQDRLNFLQNNGTIGVNGFDDGERYFLSLAEAKAHVLQHFPNAVFADQWVPGPAAPDGSRVWTFATLRFYESETQTIEAGFLHNLSDDVPGPGAELKVA